MGRTLATLRTMSTFGTWLRGDARGWVDDGVVFPEQPALLTWDANRMSHPPYLFPPETWNAVGQAIGAASVDRLNVRVYALTVQSWHAHAVVGTTRHDVAEVVKCAKDAARWCLRIDRPIWGHGYDKRWCFDWPAVSNRITYVERHNLRNGWAARPWEFLTMPPELIAPPASRNPPCVHGGRNGAVDESNGPPAPNTPFRPA